jgi:hypothetical protein
MFGQQSVVFGWACKGGVLRRMNLLSWQSNRTRRLNAMVGLHFPQTSHSLGVFGWITPVDRTVCPANFAKVSSQSADREGNGGNRPPSAADVVVRAFLPESVAARP